MTAQVKLIGAAPILIAHRGYSGRYPENTLLAYQAAYEHGARYMELDLQLTQNLVPVLHHDQSLMRMAGVDIDVRDIKSKQFKAMHASYPERFQSEFADNEFTTFRRYCKWLARHQEITTFVEIKQESIDRFGVTVVVDEIMKRINKSGVQDQCVMISFNQEAIEYTRKVSPMRIGWVLPSWTNEVKSSLELMQPDFVFCDVDLLPKKQEEVWPGNWQLAIYNLDDVNSATTMANRGLRWLETNQIGTLMMDDGLANRVNQ